MKVVCLILFLLVLGWERIAANAQITYPDSCLSIGFYFQGKDLKLETVKAVRLDDKEVPHFFMSNDSMLNLVVAFANNCNQNIMIPTEVRLDMPGQDAFTIEGFKINGETLDTLRFSMEYDYMENAGRGIILPGKEVRFRDYWFSLGFEVREKGAFKFRLRFFNMYNHIPFDQFKYYFSNWIYLTIK